MTRPPPTTTCLKLEENSLGALALARQSGRTGRSGGHKGKLLAPAVGSKLVFHSGASVCLPVCVGACRSGQTRAGAPFWSWRGRDQHAAVHCYEQHCLNLIQFTLLSRPP